MYPKTYHPQHFISSPAKYTFIEVEFAYLLSSITFNHQNLVLITWTNCFVQSPNSALRGLSYNFSFIVLEPEHQVTVFHNKAIVGTRDCHMTSCHGVNQSAVSCLLKKLACFKLTLPTSRFYPLPCCLRLHSATSRLTKSKQKCKNIAMHLKILKFVNTNEWIVSLINL